MAPRVHGREGEECRDVVEGDSEAHAVQPLLRLSSGEKVRRLREVRGAVDVHV